MFERDESTVRVPATHAPALRLLCRLRGHALPGRLSYGTYSRSWEVDLTRLHRRGIGHCREITFPSLSVGDPDGSLVPLNPANSSFRFSKLVQ